jgi:rfaE bifunctional protein nucleotidyltransferase chain/domain
LSLLSIPEALELRKGYRLVFTNGVFDILHAGHVQYLTQARSLGDLLIVGLNSDSSAKTLGKGPDRPINTLADRAAVLAALRCVDGVVSFDEGTPIELIKILQPEIHVKGGDYSPADLPETPIVEGYGGKVVILPFLPGRSTTSILKKLGGE